MHIIIKIIRLSNIKSRFAIMLFCLLLAVIIYVDIIARWGSLRAWPLYLALVIIYCIWLIYFAWVKISCSLINIITSVFMSFLFVAIAHLLGLFLGHAACVHDVRKCVDAGLRDDCVKMMGNWPVKRDVIYNCDSEFGAIPKSIRMFDPVYIIIDNATDSNNVVNIGLCKNGFGGFVIGIRVFKNDQQAEKFLADTSATMKLNVDFKFEKLEPGVYFWWQGT